jgi:hypothetical protein
LPPAPTRHSYRNRARAATLASDATRISGATPSLRITGECSGEPGRVLHDRNTRDRPVSSEQAHLSFASRCPTPTESHSPSRSSISRGLFGGTSTPRGSWGPSCRPLTGRLFSATQGERVARLR